MIAEPYLGRAPRVPAEKLRVLERGSDMVLAAHFTPLGGGWGWSPRRWRRSGSPGPSGSTSAWSAGWFPRLWRPCAQRAGGWTRLAYHGEIGADLWGTGQCWCALVARRWEQTVAASLAAVKAEAQRRPSSAVGARGSSLEQPPPTTGR